MYQITAGLSFEANEVLQLTNITSPLSLGLKPDKSFIISYSDSLRNAPEFCYEATGETQGWQVKQCKLCHQAMLGCAPAHWGRFEMWLHRGAAGGLLALGKNEHLSDAVSARKPISVSQWTTQEPYPNTCSCPFFTPSRNPCNSRALLLSTNFSRMQASRHQVNCQQWRELYELINQQ